MLAVALPKESREATTCKWFGSTLIGPTLQWYINLPTRSISSFAGLSDKFVEHFASSQSLEKTSDVSLPQSAFKRGLLPDGGLYKELTMYPCKTMEDVLSRAWAHVKWEEDIASRAKAQPKQDQRSTRLDREDREERSSQKGSKDSGSRNRGRSLGIGNQGLTSKKHSPDPTSKKLPESLRRPLRMDPHPPPHIDKIARSFKSYQPAISQINEWGTDTSTKPPRKRAPSRHQTEIGDLRTHLPQWMNETTCFMEALKTSIDRRQWPPNVNVGVKNGHDGINTQKSSEIVFPRR
uniref:Retrotransposon gag domain-containing protein n=1 Tax=Brassica oleracea var. oleracea TaxID=109376 RepID=A0A0D3ADC3_BRAOL